MRNASPLLFVLLALTVVGCQSALRNVAQATTGKLQAPDVPPHNQGEVAQSSHVTPASGVPASGESAASVPAEGAGPRMIPPGAEPLVEPTREEAFQQVLADLQEMGRRDPTAQQDLLSQLEHADPAHWESLVLRKRSELNYQQQFVADRERLDVLPASTDPSLDNHHRAEQPTERAFNLTQPPETRKAERTTVTQPWPDHASASQDAPNHRTPAIRDPAVQPTSGAMVFPGPSNLAASPYPVTPHATYTPENLAAAGPLSAAQPGAWNESLEDAIAQLEQQLSDHPQSVTEAHNHVRLRLLRLAAGDLDDAASPPPGLTSTEQQYWSHQSLSISTMLDHQSQPEVRRRAAAGGLHLKRAAGALEQLGSLTLSNLEFCEEVYGFGAYQPLESTSFQPGQEVKLYAEVENYKTVTTPQGEHTSLATSYQVLDKHGSRVDGGEVPVVNDYCARRRRDFHIQYGVTLPQGIYPGKYVLELTLTDQLGDKIGHGALDFEIVDHKQ